jgi:O-antigen/teichoic acid export membrane protein
LDNLRNKAVLKGISSDYFFSTIMIAANIAVIPIYLQFISFSDYGLWLLISSLIAIVTIFEFGGDTFLIKQLSDSKIFNTSNSIAYIYISFALKGMLTIIYILYMFIMLFFFSEKIVNDYSNPNIPIYTFIIGMIYLIFLQILSTLSSILISQNMLFKTNSMFFLINFFNLAITVTLLYFGLNIVSFAIGQLVTCFIGILWLLKEVSTIHVSLKPNKKILSKTMQIAPPLISESIEYLKSFYFIRLLHLFRNNFMNIFLSGVLSTSTVTIFNITNKIPSLVPGYISKITNALFPSYSSSFASRDFKSLKESFIKIFSLITRISVIIIICLLFLNASFVELWIEKSSFAGPIISSALILYLIPSSISAIVGSMIYASGSFGKYNLFAVLEILLTIILSYVGFKLYGFIGAVIGFVLPINITVLFLIMHSTSLINLKLIDLYIYVIKNNIVPSFSSLVAAYISYSYFFNIFSWSGLVIFVLIVFLCNIISKEGIDIVKTRDFSIENISSILKKNIF